jgi:hypothetical protein
VKSSNELEKSGAKTDTVSKPLEYKLERDVRLVDREQQQARAAGIDTLLDEALQK